MTKELHKAIMKRSRLRNKFLKDRTENNQKNFKHQIIFVKIAENHKKIILQYYGHKKSYR